MPLFSCGGERISKITLFYKATAIANSYGGCCDESITDRFL